MSELHKVVVDILTTSTLKCNGNEIPSMHFLLPSANFFASAYRQNKRFVRFLVFFRDFITSLSALLERIYQTTRVCVCVCVVTITQSIKAVVCACKQAHVTVKRSAF